MSLVAIQKTGHQHRGVCINKHLPHLDADCSYAGHSADMGAAGLLSAWTLMTWWCAGAMQSLLQALKKHIGNKKACVWSIMHFASLLNSSAIRPHPLK